MRTFRAFALKRAVIILSGKKCHSIKLLFAFLLSNISAPFLWSSSSSLSEYKKLLLFINLRSPNSNHRTSLTSKVSNVNVTVLTSEDFRTALFHKVVYLSDHLPVRIYVKCLRSHWCLHQSRGVLVICKTQANMTSLFTVGCKPLRLLLNWGR